MLDIGIDLAWGERAWSGLAALDPSGALIDARQVRVDREIADWFAALDDENVLVAIDAPIIVANATGARACERLVSRHFGRYNASCYPANTSNPAFANGTRALRIANALGWDVDPSSRAPQRAIEVYPHSALVALFDLPTVLTYKAKQGRDVEHLRTELNRLLDLLESLADAPVPMHVRTCAAWPRIRAEVRNATRKFQLAAVEDAVDAVVCAYVARYMRLQPDGVRVFGDVDTGYIVTPVTAGIAAAFDGDARASASGEPVAAVVRTPTEPHRPQPSAPLPVDDLFARDEG